MAGSVSSGVFPVWKNEFKAGTSQESLNTIAGMESFSIAIDGNVEEWKALEDEGWTRRLVTGKSVTLSLSGKRVVGDTGNDFIAGLAFKTGSDCTAFLEWTLPDGGKLTMNCVVSVTEMAGGDSTAVGPLAADLMSDGKPTFTPAA